MKGKRTMAGALQLSDEKVAFIQGSPRPALPVAAEPSTPPKLDSGVTREPVQAAAEVPGQPKPTRYRPSKLASRRELPSFGRFSLKMPITTRLQPETVETLRRTCLERRLAGTAPATLQEIVEEAVQTWLTTNAD